MSNFSNVVFSGSSPLPRTLFYFNYMFVRLLSLKQIPTFSVGERLGAPDVTNKSHRHVRLPPKAYPCTREPFFIPLFRGGSKPPPYAKSPQTRRGRRHDDPRSQSNHIGTCGGRFVNRPYKEKYIRFLRLLSLKRPSTNR